MAPRAPRQNSPRDNGKRLPSRPPVWPNSPAGNGRSTTPPDRGYTYPWPRPNSPEDNGRIVHEPYVGPRPNSPFDNGRPFTLPGNAPKRPKAPANGTRRSTPTQSRGTGRGTGSAPTGAPGGTPAGSTGRPGKRGAPRNNNGRGNGRGNGNGRGAPADTATSVVSSNSSSMFDAARRSVEADRARADAIRAQRVKDLERFDEYMRQAREASNRTLNDHFTASTKLAQENVARTAQTAVSLAQQAAGQVSGNTAILDSSGVTAAAQTADANRAANTRIGMENTDAQGYLATRAAERTNEDFARSADLRGSMENKYQNWLTQLDKQDVDIDIKEATAASQAAVAQQKLAIDQQAADFLNQYRQSQLGIQTANAETDRTNAQTRRIQVSNQATAQREGLRLRAMIANGQMSMRQAELSLRQNIAAANLASKEKDRILRQQLGMLRETRQATSPSLGALDKGLAKMLETFGSPTAANNPMKDTTDFLGQFVARRVRALPSNGLIPPTFQTAGDQFQKETILAAIGALKLQYPYLTASQASEVLGVQFGGGLMVKDPIYAQTVKSSFRG